MDVYIYIYIYIYIYKRNKLLSGILCYKGGVNEDIVYVF